MVHDVGFYWLLLYAIFFTARANYDPFMDKVLFTIKWPGPLGQDLAADPFQDVDSIFMTTVDKEKYRCVIPSVDDKHKGDGSEYRGPDERSLLNPLFKQTTCSYRIESYWTYELCHFKHFRQYHEEKESGKMIKVQEYYLGFYKNPEEMYDEDAEIPGDEREKSKKFKQNIRVQSPAGIALPYYEVNMTNGTPCDLAQNRPRNVSLHYICQKDNKGEIYEIKETSTCEYEVLVLTNLLCQHPDYQIKKEKVNSIRCHAMDSNSVKPKALDAFEKEALEGRHSASGVWLTARFDL